MTTDASSAPALAPQKHRFICEHCSEPELERIPQLGKVIYHCHNPNCNHHSEYQCPI